MDPTSDFLIRIKNGYLAKKKEVATKFSKMNESLAKILVEEGYLSQVKTQKGKTGEELMLELKYDGKKPVMTDVQRISKPGLRVYVRKNKIPRVLGGLGITIVSTPEGIMIDKKAREKNIGGEIICKIW